MAEVLAFNGWQSTPPTEPGTWLLRCGETDDYVDRTSVRLVNGTLMCDCDAGTYPVQMVHDGLTDPAWRKVAYPAGVQEDDRG